MPLPRFERLPPESRERLLAVARAEFAAHGRDGASIHRVIAEAGISKTSAYQYFDGKDDLFRAVLDDSAARAMSVLGPWQTAETVESFWSALERGSDRLLAHLDAHPDDRAVLAEGERAGSSDTVGSWVRDLVANGQRLGIIDDAGDPELLLEATLGVLAGADRLGIARRSTTALPVLLARLWSAGPRG